MYTEVPQNLPEPLRSEVRSSLEKHVLHCIEAVGACISAARRRRDEAVRASLVATAATTMLRTEDIRSILACVSYSKKNQVRMGPPLRSSHSPRRLSASSCRIPCAHASCASMQCTFSQHILDHQLIQQCSFSFSEVDVVGASVTYHKNGVSCTEP